MPIKTIQYSAQQLRQRFAGELHGDAEAVITGCASPKKATSNQITFLSDKRFIKDVQASNCQVVLVEEDYADKLPKKTCIIVSDAQACFLELVDEQVGEPWAPPNEISKHAHIHPTAQIGEGCYIGPGAVIEESAIVGAGCHIYPHTYVGAHCTLGDQVTIHPHVALYSGVSLGNRVIIHANATIGCDGFGYQFADGAFRKIKHRGTVVIEDDVEVGAGTTIDRAMFGETVIGQGTKLDNQVMIAHNCQIGRHNVFASQVGVAGSSSTGNYTRVGGQAGIADHVAVGSGCQVGAGAGIYRTVPDGETHIGYPAGPEHEQRRIVMAAQRLPDLRDKVRHMEKRLKELEAKTALPFPQPTSEPCSDHQAA